MAKTGVITCRFGGGYNSVLFDYQDLCRWFFAIYVFVFIHSLQLDLCQTYWLSFICSFWKKHVYTPKNLLGWATLIIGLFEVPHAPLRKLLDYIVFVNARISAIKYCDCTIDLKHVGFYWLQWKNSFVEEETVVLFWMFQKKIISEGVYFIFAICKMYMWMLLKVV